jgi:transposase
MSVQRKRYSAELKARVALEAIKCQKTTNEIAAEYGVHPSQISQWKKQVLDELPHLFSRQEKNRERTEAEAETTIANLYQQIGQLKVEVDYLKKKSGRLT